MLFAASGVRDTRPLPKRRRLNPAVVSMPLIAVTEPSPSKPAPKNTPAAICTSCHRAATTNPVLLCPRCTAPTCTVCSRTCTARMPSSPATAHSTCAKSYATTMNASRERTSVVSGREWGAAGSCAVSVALSLHRRARLCATTANAARRGFRYLSPFEHPHHLHPPSYAYKYSSHPRIALISCIFHPNVIFLSQISNCIIFLALPLTNSVSQTLASEPESAASHPSQRALHLASELGDAWEARRNEEKECERHSGFYLPQRAIVVRQPVIHPRSTRFGYAFASDLGAAPRCLLLAKQIVNVSPSSKSNFRTFNPLSPHCLLRLNSNLAPSPHVQVSKLRS
ncbi:hypothetical protein MVEN_02269900 [Mycena venus]|uniref:Uncharacterized protein n=1 Tax=Mycena venus TaxID=2733690 RepID=A0A8H7CFV0_9AGAR|nr:hypothetical protein MVEN_02269900 [Mycena venus]